MYPALLFWERKARYNWQRKLQFEIAGLENYLHELGKTLVDCNELFEAWQDRIVNILTNANLLESEKLNTSNEELLKVRQDESIQYGTLSTFQDNKLDQDDKIHFQASLILLR